VDLDAEHRSLVSGGFAGRAGAPKLCARRKVPKLSSAPGFSPLSLRWNLTPGVAFLNPSEELMEAMMGRGILLWLLGVPIPVIILLWLFFGR
jgi:hypothetical protein